MKGVKEGICVEVKRMLWIAEIRKGKEVLHSLTRGKGGNDKSQKWAQFRMNDKGFIVALVVGRSKRPLKRP